MLKKKKKKKPQDPYDSEDDMPHMPGEEEEEDEDDDMTIQFSVSVTRADGQESLEFACATDGVTVEVRNVRYDAVDPDGEAGRGAQHNTTQHTSSHVVSRRQSSSVVSRQSSVVVVGRLFTPHVLAQLEA